MVWLLTLTLLTAIFTVGLTSRYREQNLDLKEDLLKRDEEWQEKTFELMTEYEAQIEKLNKDLELYRRIK